MRIKRFLSVFNREDDSLAKEIDLSTTNVDLDKLKHIFKPGPDDHLMYLVYKIGPAEAIEMKKFVNENFDFDNYSYQLDCYNCE